jgi:Cu-processing system permease protein
MTLVFRLLRPAMREAIRGRWLAGLVVLLALAGELLIRFSGGGETTLVSLLDVALILTPLASLVVGTMQVHHAREMIELLLAQPIDRRRLFAGLWLGTALPLAGALVLGLLAPFAWHGLFTAAMAPQLAMLAGATALLALIGTALAFVIALRYDDRVRALGMALAAWLFAAVLWDGVVLLLALLFGDRPIEAPLLALMAMNPLDLARVLLLLGTDAAALLGYTGAVVQRTLGTGGGRALLFAGLTLWLIIPWWRASRAFARKDF